jgi:hypothetical protein
MTTITSDYTEARDEPWGVLLKGDTVDSGQRATVSR